MHKKLVVIADDFTGANDTGVQFSKVGLKVHVIINTIRLNQAIEECDVLVVDLESRFDTKEDAYNKCFALGEQLVNIGNTMIYKKLDSTLRGNTGAEIDGLMDSMHFNIAMMAPAFPGNGRTTINGEVYVHGVKLAETEVAYDPRTPVKHSRIADILSLQSKRLSHEVSTDILKGDPAARNEYLAGEINKGTEIFIFDCFAEKDLEDIANTIENFDGPLCLIAGSAGLANHLANTSIMGQQRLGFVFAGSVSERSRAQIMHTIHEGDGKLVFIEGEKLLNDECNQEEIIKSVTESIAAGNRRFIFTAAMSGEDVEKVFSLAKQKQLSHDEAAQKIAHGIGKLAATLIKTFHPSGVLLTGGEIAINTVNALNATGINIDSEILPGIQCGRLTGCSIKSVIATKAGGFGERDAISKTLEFLKV